MLMTRSLLARGKKVEARRRSFVQLILFVLDMLHAWIRVLLMGEGEEEERMLAGILTMLRTKIWPNTYCLK